MSETRERLERDLAEVEWRALRLHASRDAVIVVDPALDLVEVGERVAEDDRQRVSAWIDAGQLFKPSREHLTCWEADPDRAFRMVIVQPFVLVQPLEMGSSVYEAAN